MDAQTVQVNTIMEWTHEPQVNTTVVSGMDTRNTGEHHRGMDARTISQHHCGMETQTIQVNTTMEWTHEQYR